MVAVILLRCRQLGSRVGRSSEIPALCRRKCHGTEHNLFELPLRIQ